MIFEQFTISLFAWYVWTNINYVIWLCGFLICRYHFVSCLWFFKFQEVIFFLLFSYVQQISALKGKNIDDLLEIVMLVAKVTCLMLVSWLLTILSHFTPILSLYLINLYVLMFLCYFVLIENLAFDIYL